MLPVQDRFDRLSPRALSCAERRLLAAGTPSGRRERGARPIVGRTRWRMLGLLATAWLVAAYLAPEALAAEWASFKSFFQGSWASTWWSMGLGPIANTAAAVASLPGSGSVASAVGTGIGSMLGLTGAAATKLGTAVLGGGAAAGGGLVIAGGASLLSAALSFSSEVVLDYSATRGVQPYQAQKFREASHGMMHLPFPLSDSGPPRYREAVRRLNSIDFKTNTSPKSVMGTAEFRSALDLLRAEADPRLSAEAVVREASLLAMLELYASEYERAGQTAQAALARVGEARHRVTVLHFVNGVAMLADDQPAHEQSFAAFEKSVLEEPDNPLAPILFAAYLDRLVTRMNDRAVPDQLLHEVHELAGSVRDDKQRAVIRLGILSRYLIRIKQEQQVIHSLIAERAGEGARSDQALASVDSALAGQGDLIAAAQDRMQEFKETHCLRSFDRDRCQQLYELTDALDAYAREQPALAARVDAYRRRGG